MRDTSNRTIVRARELRRNMSLPEGQLWIELRKRPSGFKFRRQHPFGPFILDFYCAAARLAVEVDGLTHDLGHNPERDQRRDRWLHAQGVRVLRINASDVLKHMDDVLRHITNACGDYPSTTLRVVPLPAASPQGGT